MATMPHAPATSTVSRDSALQGNPNDLAVVADTILMTLNAHKEDHPRGLDEMDIMQLHPSLKLRPLREAVQVLVAQDKVLFIKEEGSRARIQLK